MQYFKNYYSQKKLRNDTNQNETYRVENILLYHMLPHTVGQIILDRDKLVCTFACIAILAFSEINLYLSHDFSLKIC